MRTAEEILGLSFGNSSRLFADPAVSLAKEAVELAPKGGECWSKLGLAQYRAGDWNAAVAALKKAMEFRWDGAEWFFLAMAHWQSGDKHQGRA